MEKFLEGVVATMDFLVYKPLFYFLNSNDEIRPLIKKIERIQATIRMFLIQRKLNKVHALGLKKLSHFLFSPIDFINKIQIRYYEIE